MKTWKEYCANVGLFPSTGEPKINKTWFAYKEGEVIVCKSRQEAKEHSKIIECKKDRKEYDEYWKKRKDLEYSAHQAWFIDLREEYNDLTRAVFDVLYNKAYDNGHAYGYDEVASKMSDLVDFYSDIIKAYKNSVIIKP